MSHQKQEAYFKPLEKELKRFHYYNKRYLGRFPTEKNIEFEKKVREEGLHNPLITYMKEILNDANMYISLRSKGGDAYLNGITLFSLENDKINNYDASIKLSYSTDIQNIYILGGLKKYCDEYIERSKSNNRTFE